MKNLKKLVTPCGVITIVDKNNNCIPFAVQKNPFDCPYSFKNAQGSPKNGLRRSAIAILRRYCRLKTDVKIIIYSRDLAGVSVTLWQRVTFLHL